MQNCTFRQKINKEHSVVLKQLTRFCNTWQGRTIEPSKIETYCNLVGYITQLHSSYVFNCMEYFTPIMKQEMIKVNKTVVEDLVKKIKYFSQYSLKSQKSYLQKEKKQICQLCSSKILQVDTKIIKEHLSDDASLRRNLLRKIYADLENQNAQLYSKDEDQVFFRFLNIMLVRKQELLAMQTKELNGFLSQVTKSLTDLNFLTEYSPGNTGVGLQRENYKQDLSKTISETLKSGFDDKIHPWMKKVFQSVKKQILAQKNASRISVSSQTQDDLDLTRKRSQYIAASENKRQVQQLKQEIQKNTITITDLKSKLTVLQKQKQQLQQQYAIQVESLLLSKRQVEIKLRKTQTDFNQLKQTNEEIIEVNKRLRNEKKKTQQSLGNRSNRSIKDLNNVSKQRQNGINQNKSQKSETKSMRRKKKSPINRLLSKRSQASQKALFIQQKSSQNVENKQKMGQNHIQPMLKKTASEIINKQQHFSRQQSLLQLKKPLKKSLKNLDRPLSKRQKSPQNEQQKVQFKLSQQQQQQSIMSRTKIKQKHLSMNKNNKSSNKSFQQLQKSCKSITQTCHNNESASVSSSLLNKKSSFGSKQNNITKSHKNMKRMLSIEMGMAPNIKISRQQKRYQRQQQSMNTTVIEENQEGLDYNGDSEDTQQKRGFGNSIDDIQKKNDTNNKSNNKKNIQNSKMQTSPQKTKKKVFQFIPLQNQQQYQQIKQKVSQITTKIEQKTTYKLKSSIKHIQLQQINQNDMNGSILNGQIGRVYGQSIFGKKSLGDKIKDNKSNISYQKSKNKYLVTIEDNNNKYQNNKQKDQHSLIDNIPLIKRKLLYQQLKRQQTIPLAITFQHYQLLVRKLFGQLSKQDQSLLLLLSQLSKEGDKNIKYNNHSRGDSQLSNNNGVYSDLSSLTNSPTNNTELLLSKYNNRQIQSSKINIDWKLLEQKSRFNNSKIHQLQKQQSNKLILNLPKLDKIPRSLNYNNLTNSNSKMTENSILQQQQRSPHFNINTMRQRLNVVKDQIQNNDNQNVNVNIKSNSNENKIIPQKDNSQQFFINQNQLMQEKQQYQQQRHHALTTTIKTAQNTPPLTLVKKLQKYTNNKNISSKHNQPFTQKDLLIFFDNQLKAYQYQQYSKSNKNNYKNNKNNYKNNNNNNKQLRLVQERLSKHQKQTISSLYSILQQIKQKNHQLYHKIFSFIKYPYQTVKHGFQFINITKQLTFQKWNHYLLTLYKLKCLKQTDNNNINNNKSITMTIITFKQFIRPFEQKMVQLIIDVTTL